MKGKEHDMTETTETTEETPAAEDQAPPANEPPIPGRCTKCGARVVPTVLDDKRRVLLHQRQRMNAKGFPRKGATLCGPVLTTWVYFLWLQWERPSAAGGEGGAMNYQVSLRHPLEDLSQVRQLEAALVDRMRPAPVEGLQLVGSASGTVVRVVNFALLRAESLPA